MLLLERTDPNRQKIEIIRYKWNLAKHCIKNQPTEVFYILKIINFIITTSLKTNSFRMYVH